jgi:hypothetical protein
MNSFLHRIKVAGVSGTLTVLLAATAFQVSAQQNFNTDVEGEQGRVTAMQRAAAASPQTVVENGNFGATTSVQDAGGSVTNLVNQGAEEVGQQLDAANKQIVDLRNRIIDLGKKVNTPAAPADEMTKTVTMNGYMTKSMSYCRVNSKDGCRVTGSTPNYAKCTQTDTFIDGTFIRATVVRNGDWVYDHALQSRSQLGRGAFSGLQECSTTRPS